MTSAVQGNDPRSARLFTTFGATVGIAAALALSALSGSAHAAPHGGGGGGHGGGGGRGGGGHSGGGYGGGRGGGGYGGRGGGYGWGGGYYGGSPLIYGSPYYCTPALIYAPGYGYGYCD